jgi:bifunctional lysine-specific demethylase and histidyl-hydroxylase NO66
VTRRFTLDWLLDPVRPATFLAEYWEKSALAVGRVDSRYFAALPGLDSVDELITATSSHSAGQSDDLRIIKTDQEDVLAERRPRALANGLPDIHAIYREYQSGCSLVINHLHRRSAAVAELCAMLERDLHHPVGANLYLTPRGAQGFKPHVDTHDVFILQLHGTKDWYVAASNDALPLPSMKRGPYEAQREYREFKLRPGEVLYLPRGFVHYAKTQTASSLHLTVRIEVYRWLDLMSEALQELAKEHADFRGALPPAFLTRPLEAAKVRDLTDILVRRMQDRALIELAKERVGTRLFAATKAAIAGQFAALDAAADLTINCTVVRTRGLLCRVRCTADAAAIEFTGNYVSGPAFLEPALTFVAEHERFAVRDLPGDLSQADKVDLVGRMINEGLLQVVSAVHSTDVEGRIS